MKKWTRKEQKEHRKLWIKALRSGEYKQGHWYLKQTRDGETLHCCLGVACDVAMKGGAFRAKWKPLEKERHSSYMGSSVYLPEKVQKWLGLRTNHGHYLKDGTNKTCLTSDNDCMRLNFLEIANLIDDEPKGLVV